MTKNQFRHKKLLALSLNIIVQDTLKYADNKEIYFLGFCENVTFR